MIGSSLSSKTVCLFNPSLIINDDAAFLKYSIVWLSSRIPSVSKSAEISNKSSDKSATERLACNINDIANSFALFSPLF